MQGIKLRRFGQEIIEKVAGKRIHSSDWIQPGGAKWPLTKERADYLLSQLPEALETTQKTLKMYKKMLDGFEGN
jgi:NAD-reducing hydrogenase large subunit